MVREDTNQGGDIKTLVSGKNKKYVKISDAGKVTLDFGKKSKKKIDKILGKDEGLALIKDLVDANEKYLYEASEIFLAKKDDGSKDAGMTSQATHGIINASNGGKDDKGVHGSRPKQGYDGQVVINPFIKLEEYDINSNIVPKKRKSIVFHELAENYLRTTVGVDYDIPGTSSGAHDLAVDREKKWNQYSPSSQPGAVIARIPIPYPSPAALINYGRIMSNYLK